MIDLGEGSLKMAKSYAIFFFSPFFFNPTVLFIYSFILVLRKKKKKNVRSSVSRLDDREKSKRFHNNRPVKHLKEA